MCNLYSLTTNAKAIRDLFKVPHNRAAVFEPLPAIFPGHVAPVIRKTDDGERELVTLNWGFILLRDGYAPKRVTNTRDDKAKSGFWRQSIEQRRCLVPASSFCEPHDGTKPVRWVWFEMNERQPRTPFAFAGIWRRYHGPVKKDGPNVEQDVFSFMTTVPNSATQDINHERSPVILASPAEHDLWLTASPAEAMKLVRPIAGERLRIVKECFEKLDEGAGASLLSKVDAR